jgi:hypothetical protein
VAYLNYKNTERSYKFGNGLIILVSLLISILMGVIIFISGVAEELERGVRNHFPGYKKHLMQRHEEFREYLLKNGYSLDELRINRELRYKLKTEF